MLAHYSILNILHFLKSKTEGERRKLVKESEVIRKMDEVVKDFFETLMYKECPLSYWENDVIIFNLLSKEIKEKIINQIKENIKNETDTILKERNFYLKNNLERNNL